MSMLGPPNAADVICLQGNLISIRTSLVLQRNILKNIHKLFKIYKNLLGIDFVNGMTIEGGHINITLVINGHAIGQ